MPILNLSTGPVHYTEHGHGVPVVLLHANPGDSLDFEAIIPALSQNYRVLAIDWPGYGQSAIPPSPDSATVFLLYNILNEFLDALKLPPAIFVGNSVGGNVAARLASEQPDRVRGLVLVAPGGFTPHNWITRSFCRLQGSRFSLSPQRFARWYLKRRNATTEAMLERASGLQSGTDAVTLNRALWRSFGRPENDLRQSARSINSPTLLMFGKYDPAIAAGKDGKAAAQSVPSAKLVVLPCGHASFAEVPELFLAEALPFLERTLQS
ncbi:alpha/beta fold hydrolase [Marinobacter zhejiangensis]|uniref:Pimeloyl-ACP methyl ester carboxylesterase n=1 Tax=Marinobacter zhejiangensis TaxID=488535 RepID=A0A1I4QGP4_9GAMM|nr:alpha/beta hydrolase [Marinobacter zhejiangensis]SFM38820.1 Pimeloyl-ACP methyl ester carboxylesterase [Marinobacter zhejiangensis]